MLKTFCAQSYCFTNDHDQVFLDCCHINQRVEDCNMAGPASASHSSPEATRQRWGSTKATIRRHLQHAVDNDDPEMTAALLGADELSRLWVGVHKELNPDPDADGQTRALTVELKLSIVSLGRAIRRENRFWSSSRTRMILRAPYQLTRSSGEECQAKVLAALQQLEEDFESSLHLWRSQRWAERVREQETEFIASGYGPTGDTPVVAAPASHPEHPGGKATRWDSTPAWQF